jgi:hypothetical protein
LDSEAGFLRASHSPRGFLSIFILDFLKLHNWKKIEVIGQKRMEASTEGQTLTATPQESKPDEPDFSKKSAENVVVQNPTTTDSSATSSAAEKASSASFSTSSASSSKKRFYFFCRKRFF